MAQISVVARVSSHVLLLGESGSGKDFVARLIHKLSGKVDELFVMVDCPGMDRNVIQSELFGHEKGAFTGAESEKKGRVDLADGGTLFLNEIGELPLDLQSRLLTFMDEKWFRRVGGLRKIYVKTRIIAATNRPIEEEVAQGRFRNDLYYRLNVVRITVPPLRARGADLPLLVQELLVKLSKEIGVEEVPEIDAKDMKRLADHTWPGNIRELKNVLEKGIVFRQGNRLELGWFDPIRKGPETERGQSEEDELPFCFDGWSWCTDFPKDGVADAAEAFRKAAVNEALRRTGGKKKPAALLLGIDRHTLARIMKRP